MPRRLREPVLASVASLEEAARARGGRAAESAAAAASRVRERLTWGRATFGVAAVAAFTIPFAAGATGEEQVSPAPATVLEPPTAGVAPEPPTLSAVAALPEPPARIRRQPRRPAPPPPPAPAAIPAPVAVATPPPPVATPAPVVQAPPPPAPAPAPAPTPPQTFDSEG